MLFFFLFPECALPICFTLYKYLGLCLFLLDLRMEICQEKSSHTKYREKEERKADIFNRESKPSSEQKPTSQNEDKTVGNYFRCVHISLLFCSSQHRIQLLHFPPLFWRGKMERHQANLRAIVFNLLSASSEPVNLEDGERIYRGERGEGSEGQINFRREWKRCEKE